MEDKLRLNGRFFSFGGIIGRHDFFLNTIIIKLITFLFFPAFLWINLHVSSFKDMFYFTNFLKSAPLWVSIVLAVGFLIEFILTLSNYTRRINDIRGKSGKFLHFLVFLFLFSISASFFISPLIFGGLSVIGALVYLFLVFKKGKVTSRFPRDFAKEFNWGAFFGGWLWGVCNKSYLPLLNILLWYTPLGFYLSLIWGLKGNEWAYKNKKFNDVEKFNKSQKNQAFFFIVFSIFTKVILVISIFFIAIFTIIYFDKEKGGIGKIDNAIDSIMTNYFETYKLEENENSFYVDINKWKGYSYKEKTEIMESGANIAVFEKSQKDKDKRFYKTDELNKTKIYDYKCNLLLGEFHLDAKPEEGIKKLIKASLNAYKFYNPDCNE